MRGVDISHELLDYHNGLRNVILYRLGHLVNFTIITGVAYVMCLLYSCYSLLIHERNGTIVDCQ